MSALILYNQWRWITSISSLTCEVLKHFVVFSVSFAHLLPAGVASEVQLPWSPYDPEELSAYTHWRGWNINTKSNLVSEAEAEFTVNTEQQKQDNKPFIHYLKLRIMGLHHFICVINHVVGLWNQIPAMHKHCVDNTY